MVARNSLIFIVAFVLFFYVSIFLFAQCGFFKYSKSMPAKRKECPRLISQRNRYLKRARKGKQIILNYSYHFSPTLQYSNYRRLKLNSAPNYPLPLSSGMNILSPSISLLSLSCLSTLSTLRRSFAPLAARISDRALHKSLRPRPL